MKVSHEKLLCHKKPDEVIQISYLI